MLNSINNYCANEDKNIYKMCAGSVSYCLKLSTTHKNKWPWINRLTANLFFFFEQDATWRCWSEWKSWFDHSVGRPSCCSFPFLTISLAPWVAGLECLPAVSGWVGSLVRGDWVCLPPWTCHQFITRPHVQANNLLHCEWTHSPLQAPANYGPGATCGPLRFFNPASQNGF